MTVAWRSRASLFGSQDNRNTKSTIVWHWLIANVHLHLCTTMHLAFMCVLIPGRNCVCLQVWHTLHVPDGTCTSSAGYGQTCVRSAWLPSKHALHLDG